MNELLTTRQVQELLKIDRTTIYRMLKDGRLPGVKVGQQWRFHRETVNNFLSGNPQSASEPQTRPPEALDVLPLPCIQAMQDVCAEMANIGAVTTDLQGQPLTHISNCGRFCRLMLSSESGHAACRASWQKIAGQPDAQPRFLTCHAGLQYARAHIKVNGKNSAMLIAGQFYTIPPAAEEAEKHIRQLADQHNIAVNDLLDARHDIPFLDARHKAEITNWLNKVGGALSQIGRERADLIGRLQRISEMSTLDNG